MTTSPSPDFGLTDKIALITGASRGIGKTIAMAYAAAGAKVVLASRKQEALNAAAAEIREAGGQALPIAAHTGNTEAVEKLVAQIIQTWGGVDIAVNNAAANPHFGHILTAEDSHWDKILDVNVNCSLSGFRGFQLYHRRHFCGRWRANGGEFHYFLK